MVTNSRTIVVLFACLFVSIPEADIHSALMNLQLQPQQSENVSPPIEANTLREYADRAHIWIGTTIQSEYWDKDPLYRQTLAKEFSSAVVFVFMRQTQPGPDTFNFREMDEAIQFGRENNIKLAGHALIYRNQSTPAAWLGFDKPDCGRWSRADLDRIMKRYIQTIVSHGKEDFYVWDVVNEPLSEEAQTSRCWKKILGEGYIANAFHYAHEANPRALLRLNEGLGIAGVNKQKVDKFFALIKELKEQGVPVHVAGIQMHLQAPKLRPTYLQEFRYLLKKAEEVGVQVHVTEMDVYQGLPGSFENPLEKQKEIFKSVAKTCLEFSHCTSFTVWGITDKYSWLRAGKQSLDGDARPLLFDENYHRKSPYFGVMEAIRESGMAK